LRRSAVYDFRSFKRADKNYYLRQAKTVRRATSLPLAIAGGTRTLGDMAAALAAGMDMISMSRPLSASPI
jgi:2,4-dienoyl-CoA reductase-like NADH-dependent reductase (Old Yellow Enzyme family)